LPPILKLDWMDR